MMTSGMDKRVKKAGWVHRLMLLAAIALALPFSGCLEFSDEAQQQLNQPVVDVFFNAPGTREGSQRNRAPSDFIVERIDNATDSVDAAVYGFNHRDIIAALIRAHLRGVKVRIVGHSGSIGHSSGYDAMEDYRIPMQMGNQFHIMHDKFFLIDKRFTFVGTGNISHSEFERNYNNWLFFDSPGLTKTFTSEFEQMFEGRYSKTKYPTTEPNSFQIGDTRVEVFFSPQDDSMGKVLEELRKVTHSIHFTIFAFTKDQVASEFINRHREFEAYNASVGMADAPILERPKKVVGILDRSQLHGNGQYHQGYRLLANGIPMRMDANENSAMPGDYQAGGGRLHAKTMVLDAGTPNARVITGSFNWSSAATISNDEVLLVLHGERIADAYIEEFDIIWKQSKELAQAMCNYMINKDDLRCASPSQRPSLQVQPGDVVISEVHWDGWNGERDSSDHTGNIRDQLTNDHFIELYNTTDDPINLSMWTITNGHDVIMGFPPGTVIMPKQYFLVLDHNTVVLSESTPQRGTHAFKNPDFVLNMANDPRFRRLNFKSAFMDIEIRDTMARTIDRAGDGGPPFFGGRQGNTNYSMERRIGADGSVPDGTLRSSWKQCSAPEGGDNVNDEYKSFIIATPGQANSQ